MPSLGKLGEDPTGKPPVFPVPVRHRRASAALEPAIVQGPGLLSAQQRATLIELLNRLRSSVPLYESADGSGWRNRLAAIACTALERKGFGLYDACRDALVHLFGPVTPTISDRCRPGPPESAETEVRTIHQRFTEAILAGDLASALSRAQSPLEEISYALGYDHDNLLRQIHREYRAAAANGRRWRELTPQNLVVRWSNGHGRARVLSTLGGHNLRLSERDDYAEGLVWGGLYGRIDGIWTLAGLDWPLRGAED